MRIRGEKRKQEHHEKQHKITSFAILITIIVPIALFVTLENS
jgi:hypothetical protein